MPGPEPTPTDLNLDLCEQQVRTDGLEVVPEPTWLEQSRAAPQAFWTSLLHAQLLYHPQAAKSSPFTKYELFYDLFSRNETQSEPALIWFDTQGQRRALSYGDLVARARSRAGVWRDHGVEPGQTICIVRPFGVDWLISLAAAIRLGLTLSVLPLSGRQYLRRRLEILAPDSLDSDPSFLSLVPQLRELLLPLETVGQAPIPDEEEPASYPTGAPFARLFDPTADATDQPRELDVDTAYLAALGDGLLALGLRPGWRYCAPGAHLLETQPAMAMAGLITGATFVHLRLADLRKQPRRLRDTPLHLAYVSRDLRDVLTESPLDLSRTWRVWHRNPAESYDTGPWHTFAARNALLDVFTGNLRWNAAAGGVVTFSEKRKGKPHNSAWPPPGRTPALLDILDPAIPAVTDVGRLGLSPVSPQAEEVVPTAEILYRTATTWQHAGAPPLRRDGRRYPLAEVQEVLAAAAPELACSLCPLPRAARPERPSFDLLVFTAGAPGVDEGALRQRLEQTITEMMGREFLPDRILVFPFEARRTEDGEIDHDWCHFQYTTGMLFRKQREPLFHLTTRLKWLVQHRVAE